MDFSAFANRNVLITGGLGFIGSNLALRCVALGSNVTVLTRSLARQFNIQPAKEQIRVVIVNLDSSKEATSALRTVVPSRDFIFHLAAQTSHIDSMEHPFDDLEANCAVTLALLETCRDLAPNAAVVMPGTVTQAGRVRELPVAEDRPDWPLSLYEAHKLACEKYLYIYHQAYGLKTTTLRLANVFGERQQVNNPRRGILNFMLKRAMTGEPITIYEPGDFIRDYSYVQNVVDALLLAAASPNTAGESYVFGSGVGLKFYEMIDQLAQRVRETVGMQAEVRRVPFPPGEEAVDAGNFIADNRKFRAHTGWHPRVGFAEGLRNTIRFYQNHLAEYTRDN